jgi:L-ascorbate metabolism protein UlaG (beta-lactamase superfamily)
MMPVPIDPAALTGIDWIFCTHQHTDHMDGVTLRALLAASPEGRLVAPGAAEDHLVNVIGVDRARVVPVSPGQHLELHADFTVDVTVSAHETLDCDDAGHALYLGFVFDFAGTRLYHSGDCVPFEGLAETLKRLRVAAALLPANGRDAHRRHHGVPGNFRFEEAVSLCEEAGIGALVPHHFGMFDFNTADPAAWQAGMNGLAGRLQVVVPRIDEALLIALTRSKP